MIAKLQRVESTAAADESLVVEPSSRETPIIAEHADCSGLEQHGLSGLTLRNRIMMANAIVWIAIIALIRLLLF